MICIDVICDKDSIHVIISFFETICCDVSSPVHFAYASLSVCLDLTENGRK